MFGGREAWRRCRGYSCEEWQVIKEKLAEVETLLKVNNTVSIHDLLCTVPVERGIFRICVIKANTRVCLPMYTNN